MDNIIMFTPDQLNDFFAAAQQHSREQQQLQLNHQFTRNFHSQITPIAKTNTLCSPADYRFNKCATSAFQSHGNNYAKADNGAYRK
jgi:hypothetical protein